MTVVEFLEVPTHERWIDEIDRYGWPGPNGSSASLDDIQGIRIGISSASFRENHDPTGTLYPASLHDYRHQLGRRLRLPFPYSLPADEAYRDGCLRRTRNLIGFSGWVARRQCAWRYRVLRFRNVTRSWVGLLPWG